MKSFRKVTKHLTVVVHLEVNDFCKLLFQSRISAAYISITIRINFTTQHLLEITFKAVL